MPKFKPLHQRFWEKVIAPNRDACWTWTGAVNSAGYGSIMNGTGTLVVHRLSYEIHNGKPGDMCVCHKCDNRLCVNPSHLFLGSADDNNKDRHAKGRSKGGSLKGQQNPCNKLTPQQAVTIFNMGGRHKDIAKTFGIAAGTVGDIKRGRIWGHATAGKAQ